MLRNFDQIQGIKEKSPMTTHITRFGTIYVPKRCGAVRVDAEETDDKIILTIHPIEGKYKKYFYVSINMFRRLCDAQNQKTLGVLLYNTDWGGWTTTIDKVHGPE